MGNHDFGHQDFFRTELNIDVHKADITREHDGKKFYLSHGDGKSNKDTGYKILKKITRNSFALWLYLKLHPNFGIRLASGTSKKSRAYTDAKNFGKTEGMEEFAEKMILNHNFDYVIMGHRHKPTVKEYGNGFYINLGEWISKPMYGIWDGNDLKLLPVADLLNNTIK
jgi:UDP-2,3-diacylglucosamine hydrolase